MGRNYHNLSSELLERIKSDRAKGVKNPYRFDDENIVRRDMNHDKANIWRPAFVRDTEKIMHIPYYSRYADKTQVFSLYKNDDISRRSHHVQYVARIARNIGEALGLNTDLIEAISLGHDIGHTPFGHAGERMLDKLYFGETGRHFSHNIHSARVLDYIFPQNISLQTLDGIICHNGELELEKYEPVGYDSFDIFDKKMEECYVDQNAIRKLIPATLEGCVMRVSDIIAYLGKDRQDAMKLGIFNKQPEYIRGEIGTSNAEIINNMTVNIIENSYGKNYLKMDEEYFEAFTRAKKENYKLIYGNESLEKVYKEQIEPMMEKIYYKMLNDLKMENRASEIYTHHIDYIKEITGFYSRENSYEETNYNDIVVDYIASMTDDYFVDLYKHLFPEGKYSVNYIGYFEEK